MQWSLLTCKNIRRVDVLAQVGVVRLMSFNARAQRDVAAAIEQLEEQGATEIELDLRDNR